MEDIDAIMPTKSHYLGAMRDLYHNGGWQRMAERNRRSYNRLCKNKEDKISRDELEYVAPDIFDKIEIILKQLWERIRNNKLRVR